ncbi:type 2 lanthipeptide synthetase LanM family protein [Bacillus manliponensis]|uniref:type 2 lanthipeptide synthetase LanM family protein n=1 Tax=Bacillus manliponensis TaxID=574376 RepID=UPI003514FA9D
MIKAEKELETLFKGSAYLQEYIQQSSNIEIKNDRLSKWKEDTGIKEDWLLEYRLNKVGMNTKQFLYVLNEKKSLDRQVQFLPWIDNLKQHWDRLPKRSLTHEDIYLNEDEVHHFSRFIYPFLYKVKTEMVSYLQQNEQLPIHINHVVKTIIKSLHDKLLNMITKTLTLELHIAKLRGQLKGETARERFLSFIQQFITENSDVLSILADYPVLARLLTEVTEFHVHYHQEILEHFIKDYDELVDFLNVDSLKLKGISCGIGDSHQQGKSVAVLLFDDQHKVLYKPRSLNVDQHFQDVLNWANEEGFSYKFKPLRLINRDGYGWTEFINYKECSHEDEVQKFYYRQGGFLALLYAVDANDFHMENIIASGEHPYLIDLETLFHNNLNMDKQSTAKHQAMKELMNSVMRTGMLPIQYKADMETSIELSGLGGRGGQLITEKAEHIRNNESDEIQIGKGKAYLDESQNQVKLGGNVVSPVKYVKHILNGFRQMYSILVNNKEMLNNEEGIFYPFYEDQIRFLVRGTQVYGFFLKDSYHPDYLQNGLDRVRLFDILWNLGKVSEESLSIITSETQDMLRGDIPYFTTKMSSTSIWDSEGNEFPGFFQKSSWERLLEKLRHLNEQDLEKQLKYIYYSLLSLKEENEDVIKETEYTDIFGKKEVITLKNCNPQKIAIEIGDYLYNQAIWGEKGKDVTWIGLGFNEKQQLRYSPLSIGLYDGNMGVTLFYAFLYEKTGHELYLKTAKAALKSIYQFLNHPSNQLHISGFSGYASIIYGFCKLYEIWKDEELIKKSMELVGKIKSEISHDRIYDLLGGNAGVLLALLKLYNITLSHKVLEVAKLCGDYLVDSAIEVEKGIAWNSIVNKTPLGGFSHGATGIAFSLYRLYMVTDNEVYIKACKKALIYQDSLYHEGKGNWKDCRDHKNNDTSQYTWCNGGAGIILGYIKMWDILTDKQRERVHLGIKSIIAKGLDTNHCLCHGNLGNYEIMRQISKQVEDPDLEQNLQNIKLKILDSICLHGVECGLSNKVEVPGFMVGLSGIGLALLYMEDQSTPVTDILLLS